MIDPDSEARQLFDSYLTARFPGRDDLAGKCMDVYHATKTATSGRTLRVIVASIVFTVLRRESLPGTDFYAFYHVSEVSTRHCRKDIDRVVNGGAWNGKP